MGHAAQENQKYRQALDISQRVSWHIEDVLPSGARLDLTRPFLPEALAGVEQVTCLNAGERRTLNQIRGHSYLRLFGLVEEFILPFVVDHARTRLNEDDYEIRALLQFAAEEAKHIQLFKLFAERFEADFGRACPMIGPASSIAEGVLAHQPLGVALMILHIEWMTQRHYLESIKDHATIDPLVSGLLKHHWLEEAQHARLDTLIVQQLARHASEQDVRRGVADYHRIVAMLDAGLCQQVELDLGVLSDLLAREFSAREAAELRGAQQAAYRFTFLQSGFEHPHFRDTYVALSRH